MDCARVAREDILEGYLLGKLSEENRDAFESHYFECADCFDDLQAVWAVRDELVRVRTEPDLGRRRVFQWAAVAAFGMAALITVAPVLYHYRLPSASSGMTESRASSRPAAEATESQSNKKNDQTEPAIEQKSRTGEASRVPVSQPGLPARPVPRHPTPQPSSQPDSRSGVLATSGRGPDEPPKATNSVAEQAKEDIGQLVNNYCSALESLQPTRVRSLFHLDSERALMAEFTEYESLRCTVTSPPEYSHLDAGPAGSALIEVGMKLVIKKASADAPDTRENILTMVVSRRGSQSPWLIDHVRYQLKAK
jgi:hypothetical protein